MPHRRHLYLSITFRLLSPMPLQRLGTPLEFNQCGAFYKAFNQKMQTRWATRPESPVASNNNRQQSHVCRISLEAAGGFEPPYNGFADRRLTTWLSRPLSDTYRKTVVHSMSRPERFPMRAFCYSPSGGNRIAGCGKTAGGCPDFRLHLNLYCLA